MSVGNPEVTSYVGQPLRMRVPVALEDAADASGQCVRLINSPAGDVPGLTFGRVELERTATASYLRITSPMPIGEPILRVAVEIGCIQRVRREFTLFLDPPPAGAGTAIAEGAPPVPPRIEFGPPEVIGYQGQPLLVSVPISGEMANSLTEACVRPGRSGSTEPPRVLNDIRVALIDRSDGRSLRIHTPDPVNDPRVRVIVEVGCDRPIRREFALQIEPPRLAAAAAEEAAVPVVPAPGPRRPAAPVARAKLPPVLPPPPAAPAAPPPVRAETPAETRVPPIQPAQLPPREQPAAGTDRLVLAPAEEPPRAAEPETPTETPAPEGPSERERAVLKQVEELAAEVKKLRAELEASNLRNRELAERADTGSYAWISAVAAVFLLGLGFLIGWRGRPRAPEARVDADRAGPMTRILGQKTEHRHAPLAAAAGATAGAAASAEARRQPTEDTQPASTAIMVTEFGDTTQVLGELYSPYIGRGQGVQSAPPPQPAAPNQPEPAAKTPEPNPNSEATTIAGPPTKTEIALDLDLGQERPSILSPQTKTEIAVDIDLFERNSQIGRDLQREYERLDLLGGKGEPAPESKPAPEPENEPPTIAGTTTVPLTTKLDLDLDLSTIGQGPTHKPKKPQ